jgi:hypothetical protein
MTTAIIMTCLLRFFDTRYFRYVAEDLCFSSVLDSTWQDTNACYFNNRKQREEYAAALEGEVRIDDAGGDSKNADVESEADYSDEKKGGPSAAELEMALSK